MKNFVTIAMTTAALLLPVTVLGDEAKTQPTWEFQAALDGQTPPAFSRCVKDLLGGDGINKVLSGNTVVRFAEFENKDTPERDWIGEVRGMRRVDEMLHMLGAKDGKAVTKDNEREFAIWSEGATTLNLATPAVNAERRVAEMAPLKSGVWLAGWIDLERMTGKDIQSKLLKLPQQLSFTASGTGDVVTVELRAKLKSAETAKTARFWILELQLIYDQLNSDPSAKLPPFTCEAEGESLILRVDFKEQNLERLLTKIKTELTAGAGDGKKAGSDH